MSVQKQQNGMTSCSSTSSLSNIALRNRTVSRDSVLYFSEDNVLCESLSDVQAYSPNEIKCKRRNHKSQKCCLRKEPLRKFKNANTTNISKRPTWQIQDTIVVAPFYALKECFQNQIKEICGKKNLTNGFTNKKDDISNNIVQVETLVPISREDLIRTDKNRPKRKRRSTSPEESNYCDCVDDSNNCLSEACVSAHNNHHQAMIDLRNDSDGSSVILEKIKRPKRCWNTTFSSKKSKPSRPQNKRKRKTKGNLAGTDRGTKLTARTKKNDKNASGKKKKSRDGDISRKTLTKRSQPRYHTRSVTKKEKEKKDRLLKMMRAQNKIITKIEDLESSASSKDQPSDKKQTKNDALFHDKKASDPSQQSFNEPPCVVLHPFDPSKRKPEGNLSDYSSDESISEPSHEESEQTAKMLSPNTEIQNEVNALNNHDTSDLGNKTAPQEHLPPKKTLEGFNINLLEESLNSYVESVFNLRVEEKRLDPNTIENPGGATAECNTDDFLMNPGTTAETIEPSVIVQEHYNEPSSVGSSLSDQRDDYELKTCDSSNRLELPSFCCSVQEPDQESHLSSAGYVFGPRNDFSRLRESCEFTFGLSSTIQNDQDSDTENYLEL